MLPFYSIVLIHLKKQNSRLANHIITAHLIIIPLASAVNIVALAVSEYPVYHSLYDDFVWMERFGDPLFHRHVACTERELSFQIQKVQSGFHYIAD